MRVFTPARGPSGSPEPPRPLLNLDSGRTPAPLKHPHKDPNKIDRELLGVKAKQGATNKNHPTINRLMRVSLYDLEVYIVVPFVSFPFTKK